MPTGQEPCFNLSCFFFLLFFPKADSKSNGKSSLATARKYSLSKTDKLLQSWALVRTQTASRKKETESSFNDKNAADYAAGDDHEPRQVCVGS